MRSYSCTWYGINKEGKFEKNYNEACWAGLNQWWCNTSRKWKITTYQGTLEYVKDRTIYIDKYTDKKTEEFIKLLVSVINKITPCKIETYDNKEYITFKLLDTFDQSLILLNFIRYLWCDYGTRLDTIKFFETLRDDKTYKKPLERLLYANKTACAATEYPGDHSNIASPKKLRIKTSKQLLEWKGTSTQSFLTSD